MCSCVSRCSGAPACILLLLREQRVARLLNHCQAVGRVGAGSISSESFEEAFGLRKGLKSSAPDWVVISHARETFEIVVSPI